MAETPIAESELYKYGFKQVVDVYKRYDGSENTFGKHYRRGEIELYFVKGAWNMVRNNTVRQSEMKYVEQLREAYHRVVGESLTEIDDDSNF